MGEMPYLMRLKVFSLTKWTITFLTMRIMPLPMSPLLFIYFAMTGFSCGM